MEELKTSLPSSPTKTLLNTQKIQMESTGKEIVPELEIP